MNHHVIGGRKGGRRRSKLLSPEARSAIARKGAEARWRKHDMKNKRFNEEELDAMEKEGLRPQDMPTEEEIEESKKLLESIRNGTANLYPYKLSFKK